MTTDVNSVSVKLFPELLHGRSAADVSRLRRHVLPLSVACESSFWTSQVVHETSLLQSFKQNRRHTIAGRPSTPSAAFPRPSRSVSRGGHASTGRSSGDSYAAFDAEKDDSSAGRGRVTAQDRTHVRATAADQQLSIMPNSHRPPDTIRQCCLCRVGRSGRLNSHRHMRQTRQDDPVCVVSVVPV